MYIITSVANPFKASRLHARRVGAPQIPRHVNGQAQLIITDEGQLCAAFFGQSLRTLGSLDDNPREGALIMAWRTLR